MALPFGLDRLFRRPAPALRTRGFEAGRPPGTRWNDRPFGPINSEVGVSASAIRRRARQAMANNPHLAAATSAWAVNLVGYGVTPTPQHADAAARAALLGAWNTWTPHADLTGIFAMPALLETAARALVVDGEAFFRLIASRDGLRLQAIPAELVSDESRDLAGGGAIVNGVELDSTGRRVAFHIFPASPLLNGVLSPVRIPASEILHVFRPLLPGQTRGVSWFAPVLLRAHELDQLTDALLMGAKIAAMFSAIRTHVGESNDDPAVIHTRMADALTHRMGALAELPDAARQYRALGFAGMARVMLAARGERVVSLSDEAVLTRAMTTGDLPQLLQGTGHRTLLASYENARSPVLELFRRTEGRDFRTMHRLRVGELGLLQKVPESGEVTHGGVGESGEAYKIESYARMFGLTRQAIINDDLGAFSGMMSMQGRQAAETLNNAAVALLTQGAGLGPVMSDGQRLFHATHGNVATTPAIPGDNAFAFGLAAMRKQKGVDGETPINVVPRSLLVPPDFEGIARRALAEFAPATADDVNAIGRMLSLMVEPRLSGERWYMFADPATMPCFEVAYLASSPGPQMESRPGWDVLGMEFRCVFDFGVGAIDWRGGYTNEGDEPSL